MRALRFHGARDLRLEDVPPPPEPGPGEVLVAPVLCGICGTDLHEYEDGPRRTWAGPEPHPLTGGGLPQILGHELSGEVAAVGPGVGGVGPGDRVSVMPLVACGRCARCRGGEAHLCPLRASVGLRHPWGGFADLVLVRAGQAAPLPDGVSYEQGALIEPAAVGAMAARTGEVGPGDRVLVLGAGPIGALAALAVESAGAADVLVAEPNPARAARAASLGFDVVDPSREDVVAACAERTGGEGVDVAVDCAGSGAAIRTAVAAVRPGGTVVVTALHGRPAELDLADVMIAGKSLRGAVAYPLDSWPELLAEVASGRFPVERVAGRTVPLEAAVRDGFERLLEPDVDELKVLVAVR